MAKVYGKSEYKIGLFHKNGSAFGTDAAVDSAYKLLPVINVSSPILNLVESGEIRSNNAGMIETDLDQFRTRKGGFVTLDFEVPAERSFLSRMVANVLQDHTEGGSGSNLTHTSQAKSGALLSRPDFDASSSAGIPSLFDIGLYGAGSGDDKLMTSAVLQSLTLNFDMSDGRLLLSGTFYSGFANNGFKVGQTLSANSGSPSLMSSTVNQIESYFDTKTLDINGSATAAVITGVSFTIENNIARVGRAGDGDAENYAFGIPSVNITGEISLMYDDNFNDGANNVLQDFLDGDTATLTLKQTTDGTVSTAGEMSIIAEIYSTAVNYDLNADTGAIITIPFKVVQPTASGLVNGTAFEFIHCDGISNSSW
tara:strand:+ start:1982 stop:3085 length:1104 start_codon:yes stop_codon:yes gene_type:complete